MLVTSGANTIKSQAVAVQRGRGGDKIIASQPYKEFDLF